VIRAWYQRVRSIERGIERNFEHETLHHVLYNRIGLEACLKLDNLSFDWKPPLEFACMHATMTKNPRLLRISFHTLRHFKATIEYHKTKDILHAMRVLGHKNIKNTLIYTQLVNFQDDEYISKVAWTLEEGCKLVKAGFEYVTEIEGGKIFRKRK